MLAGATTEGQVTLRAWTSANGIAMSMQDCVPWLWLQLLQLATLVRTGCRRAARGGATGADYDVMLQATTGAIEVLQWLMSPRLEAWNGMPIHHMTITLPIVVDADRRSYGFSVTYGAAHMDSKFKERTPAGSQPSGLRATRQTQSTRG